MDAITGIINQLITTITGFFADFDVSSLGPLASIVQPIIDLFNSFMPSGEENK